MQIASTCFVGLATGFFYTFCAFASIPLVIQLILRHGKVCGIWGAVGHLIAQIAWVTIAIAILNQGSIALQTHIYHYRIFAALLLLLLGLRLWLFLPSLPKEISSKNKNSHYLTAFLTIFSVAISAPGRTLGYLALFVLLGNYSISVDLWTQGVLLLSTLLGVVCWWLMLFAVMMKIKITPTHAQICRFQRGTGVLLILLAINAYFFVAA